MIGPRDFFDTLAALEWNDRFESFTPTEQLQLRRYHELATDLGDALDFKPCAACYASERRRSETV